MIERLKGYKLKPGDVVYDTDVRIWGTSDAVKLRVCSVDISKKLLVLEYLSGPKRYTEEEDGSLRFVTYCSWYKIPNTNVIGPINYIKKMEF